MLQDTNLQSILQSMGAGPGSLQNGGVGISSMTGGMGAQEFANNQTNTGLNQASQDIQNQTAQHALEQARLGDPAAAQAREAQMLNTGQTMDQLRATGPQDKMAAANAATMENYAKSDAAGRAMAENRAEATASAQAMVDAGGGDTEVGRQAIRDRLIEGKVKNVPEIITPEYLQELKHMSAGADSVIKAARSVTAAEKLEKMHRDISTAEIAGKEKVAEITAGGAAATLAKGMTNAQIADINIRQTGEYTQTEKDILINHLRKEYDGTNAAKDIYKDKEQEIARLRARSDSKAMEQTRADAEADNIGIPKGMSAEAMANKIADIHADRKLQSAVDKQFAQTYASAKLVDSKPGSGVSKGEVRAAPFNNQGATAPVGSANPQQLAGPGDRPGEAPSGKLPRVKVPGGTISGEEALAKGIK